MPGAISEVKEALSDVVRITVRTAIYIFVAGAIIGGAVGWVVIPAFDVSSPGEYGLAQFRYDAHGVHVEKSIDGFAPCKRRVFQIYNRELWFKKYGTHTRTLTCVE
jgi:hypothetical protein